jgi:hypothetical protein
VPSSPPHQRSRFALDYLLVAGTSVLFLLYLPLFVAAPRLMTRHLGEVHLLWLLPLLLICSCMAALCSWGARGATHVERVLWTLAFVLAGLGCPVSYVVGMVAGPG